MSNKKKIIRITTVPHSLGGLLRGQLKYMSQYYEIIGISSWGSGHLEKVGQQEGIPVVRVEMTRKITPLKDLKAFWKIYRFLRKEKPFIVHTHTPKAGTLGMMAAFCARVPYRLHTIAGMPLLEATGTKRKLLDYVEKLTFACATKIYPNSYGLYDIVLQHKYTKEEKLKIIGKGSSNGVDTSHFDPSLYSEQDKLELRNKYGISENDFVYIFIGRLVKDKGINELVGAFKELGKQLANIKLVLVGEYESHLDPLSPETHREIENNPDIVFTGGQPDVRPYLAMSDLLVFPSYREGLPNVVMEACSMGMASVVSDINGCNEIVEHGRNGLIVPPKDQKALMNAMQDLYQDREKLLSLAENARPMVAERFERRYVWSQILKEYRKLDTAS